MIRYDTLHIYLKVLIKNITNFLSLSLHLVTLVFFFLRFPVFVNFGIAGLALDILCRGRDILYRLHAFSKEPFSTPLLSAKVSVRTSLGGTFK